MSENRKAGPLRADRRKRRTWTSLMPGFIGISALVFLGLAGGLWGTQTRISGAVLGKGKVQFAEQSTAVQHPIGGVVKEILAHNGERVTPGQVVIRLDDTDLRSKLAIVEGQLTSLSLSILLVFVLVSLVFRSLGAGFWSVVPLGIAIPVLFGLMGFFGIELNVVTAMLSSIMIGVGVDYTIHFLWRYRNLRRDGQNPEEAVFQTLTTTGRGIVFNALSVIAGFAVLLISNFLPVKFFGFLVVVSITACLLGALVLLPAICLVLRPGFLEP